MSGLQPWPMPGRSKPGPDQGPSLVRQVIELEQKVQHREEAIAALTAERDRLAEQVQRVRSLTLTEINAEPVDIHGSKRVTVGEIRQALDGGAS